MVTLTKETYSRSGLSITGDSYVLKYVSRTSTSGIKTAIGKGRKRRFVEYNDYEIISSTQSSGRASDYYWKTAAVDGVSGAFRFGWFHVTRLNFIPGPNITNRLQFSADCDRIAIFRLQSAIRQGDFNLTVTGAEAGKSVKTITDTARRIAAGASALKRGRLGDLYKALNVPPPPRFKGSGPKGPVYKYPPAKKVRENAGNLWMEVSYGWIPLLSDIKNACESIANIVNAPNIDIFFAHGSCTTQGLNEIVSTTQGASDYRLDMLWSTGLQYGCRYQIAYRISSGTIATAARLGLTNPLSVAWEVIPLSFVVDWFIPVGAFVGQLSAYHGLDFARGLRTQKARHTANGGQVVLTKEPMETDGAVNKTVFRLQRNIITSFPYAGLIVKDPFSVSRAITSLALAQQMLGSLFRK